MIELRSEFIIPVAQMIPELFCMFHKTFSHNPHCVETQTHNKTLPLFVRQQGYNSIQRNNLQAKVFFWAFPRLGIHQKQRSDVLS